MVASHKNTNWLGLLIFKLNHPTGKARVCFLGEAKLKRGIGGR
jgi:hypothetical protein